MRRRRKPRRRSYRHARNLSINFLKRPAQKDLLAETRLIKLGKRLAVADIAIRSEGEDELVAHATTTYSIPPTNS
jgi:acyl-coenzyme A thioesterase PaaI-like protein